MGQAVEKLRHSLVGKEQKRVLLVGANGSGKTCLLYGLKLGFDETFMTMPTVGFNVETWTHKFKSFTIWDLGLRSKMRPLVKHYIPGTDMVIFMIDGCHPDDFDDAEELFGYVKSGLEAEERNSVPFLFFMNKQDLPQKMSMQEVVDRLKLNELAKTRSVHLAPCCAKTGEGVQEGMDFLISFSGGTGLSTSGVPGPDGPQAEKGTSGYAGAEAAPPAASSTPALVEAKDLADAEFLEAFREKTLNSFGPTEMMRLSLMERPKGFTALGTLEMARLKGYVAHSTRMHFWAQRLFSAPMPEKVKDTRSFLEAHPELLPKTEEEQEALIHQAYSEKIDTEATWAHMVVPPDLKTADDDASFWARLENEDATYSGELDSFCSVVRLAFILLKAMPRKSAIQRLDSLLRRLEARNGRPFHETRQYVALQFAHLALTQHPSLQEKPFAKLQDLCPELCEEDSIYRYYSEKALAQGTSSFQPPDLQPLPSKLDMPEPTWHEKLNDQEFLEAVQQRSLKTWGLPSLARLSYLYLGSFGRRQAVQTLLKDVEDLRTSAKAGKAHPGLFAHETLAYFTIHMIHYLIASQKLSMTQPFKDVVQKCDKIVDSTLYRAYYSDKAIHCTEARSSFVVPDLCPLPDLLPS